MDCKSSKYDCRKTARSCSEKTNTSCAASGPTASGPAANGLTAEKLNAEIEAMYSKVLTKIYFAEKAAAEKIDSVERTWRAKLYVAEKKMESTERNWQEKFAKLEKMYSYSNSTQRHVITPDNYSCEIIFNANSEKK